MVRLCYSNDRLFHPSAVCKGIQVSNFIIYSRLVFNSIFSSIKVQDIHFLNLVFLSSAFVHNHAMTNCHWQSDFRRFYCSSQPSRILWLSSSIFPCWLFVPPWWHLLLLLLLRLLQKFPLEMVWNGKKIGQITFLTPWPPALSLGRGGEEKRRRKIFFQKWSEKARKLVKSPFWHHGGIKDQGSISGPF